MVDRTCAFDQGKMVILQGSAASMVLLDMLMSPTSILYNTVKGSVRTNPNGVVMKCPDCGWVAIFAK